mmetsp:Transcript_10601/g.10690  ORF Transcript_10601/g.10690 Transcript_10601/m.10690 type:complete len:98 (+) Transcript_10601:703-996(+)
MSALYKVIGQSAESKEGQALYREKAVEYLEKAVEILVKSTNLRDKMELAQVYTALGTLLKEGNHYEKSSENLKKGVEVLEELLEGDKEQQMTIQLSS